MDERVVVSHTVEFGMSIAPPEPSAEYEIDEPFKKFFSAVGYAITRWAYVDAALFHLCDFSLGRSKEMTAVIFYRSKQISDHLVLTDQLMQSALSSARLKKWEKIFRAANKLLPFRNHLAHNPPMQVLSVEVVLGKEPEFPQPPPRRWWEITTEETKLLHKKGDRVSSTLGKIVDHIRAVEALLDELWALQDALPARPSRPRAKPRVPESSLTSNPTKRNVHATTKR